MIQKGWTDIKKVNFNESSKEFIKKIKDEFEKDNSQQVVVIYGEKVMAGTVRNFVSIR